MDKNLKTKKKTKVVDLTSEDIHIKNGDLCDRCAFGVEQCGMNCDICAMQSSSEHGFCLCLEVVPCTPCPYFKEATNEGK